MLKWTSHPSRRDETIKNYDVDIGDKAAPEDYLEEFKDVLVRFVLKQSLPRTKGPWNIIHFNYWFDCGRMDIYPASEPYDKHTVESVVVVFVPQAQRYWDEVSELERKGLIDNEFTDRIVEMEKQYTNVILRAIEESNWKSHVNNLYPNKLKKLCFMTGDEQFYEVVWQEQ